MKATAQENPTGSNRPQSLIIDTWITDTVPIRLTVDQRKRFDSVRMRFSATVDSIKADGAGRGGVMRSVAAMRDLTDRYEDIVRGLLTLDQLPAFEKNLTYWRTRPRRIPNLER